MKDRTALKENLAVLALMTNDPIKKRICTLTGISTYSLLASGSCTYPYENRNTYEELRIRFGLRHGTVAHMKTHNKYNMSNQHEYDIGMVTVSNLTIFLTNTNCIIHTVRNVREFKKNLCYRGNVFE